MKVSPVLPGCHLHGFNGFSVTVLPFKDPAVYFRYKIKIIIFLIMLIRVFKKNTAFCQGVILTNFCFVS